MSKLSALKLLAGSALGVLSMSGLAHAQQASAKSQTLEEVVVTATRQTDTVHGVPLTISAVTAKDVERQGLKVAGDLTQVVTSLRISGANSGGAGGVGGSITSNAQIAIRGISSSVTGAAATTGIYVDDVPLQQRTPIGPTGGGTALPTLFDLQRVEVLKGPQGTLYGGSSEGGTLRFLTQQPSLTKHSLYVRTEGSSTEGGDANYEFGVTGGGPLIEDRVAVNLTGFFRHDGGYIDHVSQFTGNVLPGGKNTNSAFHEAFHGSVLVKLNDRASATLSYLYQDEKYHDSDNYWENFGPYQADVSRPGDKLTPGQLFSYGPYNMFGAYRSGNNTNIGKNFYTSDSQLKPILTPHSQSMSLPSLVLDYAFDKMNVKLISAYNETKNRSDANTTYSDITGRGSNNYITPQIPQTVEGRYNALPANSPYIANLPVYNADFASRSQTNNLTEELRFSSNDPQSPLTWVGGVFYQSTRLKADGLITSNLADVTAAIFNGISQTTAPGTALTAPSSLSENQIAAYGEATYKITDKLRATIGLRITRDDFSYKEIIGGTLFGFPPGFTQIGAQGSLTSNATTPKFGLQYVLDSNTNFYVTAAQGYRPGGINQVLSPACGTALGIAGYPNGAPLTFTDDSLWSYEGGAKLRAWGGKALINASVFYIDWKKVQTTIDLGCGNTFAINAGSEVSQGFDFDGSLLLFPGFTASLRAGYTDAHFTTAVRTPTGAFPLINAGDTVPYTPKWQADLTGEYKFRVLDKSAYVRADYSYEGAVVLNYGSGTVSYLPDNHTLGATRRVNARAGLTFDKFEIAAFVDNLTDSKDLLFRGGFSTGPGRYGCLNNACTAYNKYSEGGVNATFRPRTIGVTASYRY